MNDAAILTYTIFWGVVLLFLCTVERGAFRYYRGKKKKEEKSLLQLMNRVRRAVSIAGLKRIVRVGKCYYFPKTILRLGKNFLGEDERDSEEFVDIFLQKGGKYEK